MKFHFKRVNGLQVMQLESMQTLLTQIEAILNSRPIHPLSDDPDDMQALATGFEIAQEGKSIGTKLFRQREQMVKHFCFSGKNEEE